MSNEIILISSILSLIAIICCYKSGEILGYEKGYNEAMKEYNERYNK